MHTSDNNKRIAKNTILLYFRMFLTMAITLYTSRIVLNVLGIENFGIYNIVGGIVILFSFLNNAMANATQRFLNFELGKQEHSAVERIFSMSMTIHIGIALLVLILSESIGLWFLNTQMNIPEKSIYTANWVYQFSILTCCIQIIRIPYHASIIAYEKMSFYAYISIIEVVLKLIIVYLLVLLKFDKLILYAALTLGVTLLINFCYKIYCLHYLTTCHYHYFWDIILFKKLASFSGWSLLGNAANVGMHQGTNILLNIFYGVTVNAAMGIVSRVTSAIFAFVTNFQIAFNPQIVKYYSSDKKEAFLELILQASKYSFYLLFLLSFPFILNANFILKIWLKMIPEYTVNLCILSIFILLIEALNGPLWMSIQATGKIKTYQLLISVSYWLNLLVTYILLKTKFSLETIFIAKWFITVLALIIRIIYFHFYIQTFVKIYLQEVILPIIRVLLIALPIPIIIKGTWTGWTELFTVTFITLTVTLVAIYYWGIKKNERHKIENVVQIKFKKWRNLENKI